MSCSEKLKAGKLQLDDAVAISPQAVKARGARLFLRPGTTARAEDLLQGMIVVSANDAAVALAEHVAKNEANFVMEMNLAARALGLTKTSFVNVTGHDEPGQASTAHDLARLSSALIRDFPEYYEWFAQKEFTHLDITQHNHNALLWRDLHVDGVKTGQTRSGGYCLSASADRDGMRLIATVLGARDDAARVSAGQKLLEHGFRHFETRLLYAADVPALRVRLWMGDQSTLPLGVRQNLYLTLPRGWHEKLHARLVVQQEPAAPVQQGQVMGTLALDLDRQPYAEYPLVALQADRRPAISCSALSTESNSGYSSVSPISILRSQGRIAPAICCFRIWQTWHRYISTESFSRPTRPGYRSSIAGLFSATAFMR